MNHSGQAKGQLGGQASGHKNLIFSRNINTCPLCPQEIYKKQIKTKKERVYIKKGYVVKISWTLWT